MAHAVISTVLVTLLLAWAPVTIAASAEAAHVHEHKPAVKKKARAAAEKPYGRPGDPRRVKRSITIDASDAMRFFPESVNVKRGDTVRFEVRNGGQLPHEMVIGTMDELKKHAALMKKSPEMDHDDAHAAHLKPGENAQLVWQFTKPGEFYFACLVPGHFDAGMIGTIVVR